MRNLYIVLLALFVLLIDGTNKVQASPVADGEEQFYVENIKASSSEGIVITFSEEVKKVNHNMFGSSTDKCLMIKEEVSSSASEPTPMNVGTPIVSGNVVTCPKTFGTNLVPGSNVIVTLQPQHFISVSGRALTGPAEWTLTVDEGQQVDGIVVTNYTPSDGYYKVGMLNNITAEFRPRITKVLDTTLVILRNERNHVLELSSVGLDTENPYGAININVAEDALGEEGTTYSLHLLPGAILCDGEANEKEIVFGKWTFATTPITLSFMPSTNAIIEELREINVSCDAGELTFAGNAADIVVTGVMEYQVNTYATCVNAKKNTDGSYTLTFDKVLKTGFEQDVTTIPSSSAGKNQVKVMIPEGAFKVGNRSNRPLQIPYTIKESVTLGEITWTFNPAAGSTVETLGVGSVSEDDGTKKTTYAIHFAITEENNNLYVRIPSASDIKIYNAEGKAVKSFEKYDIFGGNGNRFALDLGTNPLTAVGPAAKTGEVTLVIPAESVLYYTDANYNSEPSHPDANIEVTWTLAVTDGIREVQSREAQQGYTIGGIKATNNQKGLVILQGKKVIQ